ncbi:MAG: iron-siderophore ABC transporter substrate-binding protein [Rivularia sp. (in: Bacteria)]|nr:iron-siderophore ABC transporter substrate-binding protein [Rivularia sp. MS3]
MKKHSRRFFIAAAIMSALTIACENKSNISPQKKESNISKTPTRIVALEWVYVENLLALGIQPVGIADIKGYKNFVNIKPQLADSVVDIGTRAEPSIEAIAKLKPDLILGVEQRHKEIYILLKSIAPTFLFNPYPSAKKANQLEEMQQTFTKIAKTVNREDKGKLILDEMQQSFDNAKKQLDNIKVSENKFVLAQLSNSGPQLRLFSDNSMAVQILNKIGLENAFEGKFDAFGFNTVWVEALPEVEDTNFIYISADNNVYWQNLQNNPVWKGLEFVQQNRVYPIEPDTWVFGGPLSAQLLVEKVVAALK